MMRNIYEEVFNEETETRMLKSLESDLKRYLGRKIAVILLQDDTIMEIWMRDGVNKFLYEIDIELYNLDGVHNILSRLGFERIW